MKTAPTGKKPPLNEGFIRLVQSPAGRLVVDLAQELKGPELALECKKSILAKAVEDKLLEAHFGSPMAELCPEPLDVMVEKALRKRALSYLGIAKKDGSLLSGFTKVSDAMKTHKAAILLVEEGSHYEGGDDVRKWADGVLIADCFSLSELQSALSNGNSMHVVLKGRKIAEQCKAEIQALLTYLERTELDDQR